MFHRLRRSSKRSNQFLAIPRPCSLVLRSIQFPGSGASGMCWPNVCTAGGSALRGGAALGPLGSADARLGCRSQRKRGLKKPEKQGRRVPSRAHLLQERRLLRSHFGRWLAAACWNQRISPAVGPRSRCQMALQLPGPVSQRFAESSPTSLAAFRRTGQEREWPAKVGELLHSAARFDRRAPSCGNNAGLLSMALLVARAGTRGGGAGIVPGHPSLLVLGISR